MKESKKTTVEKYLSQKYNTIPEAILFVIGGLGVISFFAYSKFLAVPLLVISAVALVFIKTSKIKDAEYEDVLERILLENNVKRKGENILAAYDLSATPIGIGMDKKARTPIYSIAEFVFSSDSCTVKLSKADMINSTLTSAEHEIPLPAGCERKTSTVETHDGQRKVDFLVFSSAPMLVIPVEQLSYDVEVIINRLNEKK